MLAIEINQANIKSVKRALNNVVKESHRIIDDLPKEIADAYVMAIIAAISSQKYAGVWPDLSKKHKALKARLGYDPRFWVMTGDLLAAIRATKIKTIRHTTTYFGGVRSGINGGYREKEMATYGEFNEKSRPLFYGQEFDTIKSIWLKKLNVAARRVIKQWVN